MERQTSQERQRVAIERTQRITHAIEQGLAQAALGGLTKPFDVAVAIRVSLEAAGYTIATSRRAKGGK